MDRLSELAAQWGVDSNYIDALGRPQTVAPEALSRIVSALEESHASPVRALPASFVIRQNRDHRLFPPAQFGGWEWGLLQDDAERARGHVHEGRIDLPHDLPVGCYRLRVGDQESLLLVAPERAWQCDGPGRERLWVLAVQLYGIRSGANWGIGDFGDLMRLIDLAAEIGAAGIALNPIHALFDDRPEQASPYAPNSRLFINPLYIDVSAIPEFPGVEAAGLAAAIEGLRKPDLVDYSGVAAAKLKGLRIAYERFRAGGSTDRRAEFETFRAERGDSLARFAAFEVLRRRFPQVWWDWPEPWRHPGAADLAEFRRQNELEIGYHEFVQWIADTQLRDCRIHAQRHGLPIGLYLDVAVGVDAGGADAWSEPEAVLASLSVGAPPDVLNTAGQNWGLAGFNPVGLESRRFAPFRAMVRSVMRHAGAIRIDHVLGLKRLFMIPHGMKAQDGAYVRLPFDGLLAVIAQESVRQRCVVIGEDLGTVPEGFRDTMWDWGLWSYQVLLFERGWDGAFRRPEHFNHDALVTFSTHDLCTFAGWRSSHDLAVKRGIGMDPGESDEQRGHAITAMRHAVGVPADAPLEFEAIARYLASAATRLLVVSMEDAIGEVEQPNVPGTVTEHPNWRRRLSLPLDDLFAHPQLRRIAEAIASAGRGGNGTMQHRA